MRKIYRDKNNQSYWDQRWEQSGVDEDQFVNEAIYPIKYANLVIKCKDTKILEAGCGAGRVYFHYKKQGYPISGIEYSQIAVTNILQKDKQADVVCGSITDLPYKSGSYDTMLAFGLYHNIENEHDLKRSFTESARVLKSGGKLVASVRCDSLENNLIEKIVRKRKNTKDFVHFHRWHFNERDFREMLTASGFTIEEVFYSRNVSFLFKYDWFRTRRMKSDQFCESDARSSGFELNNIGKIVDTTLHSLFPKMFSNLLIMIARKN